ncbi:hypothetical protein M758_UG256600 [Ceratodon purpureus]|nr:hypothetical protein M758_UG256600 [Ceratodon purpureus]
MLALITHCKIQSRRPLNEQRTNTLGCKVAPPSKDTVFANALTWFSRYSAQAQHLQQHFLHTSGLEYSCFPFVFVCVFIPRQRLVSIVFSR